MVPRVLRVVFNALPSCEEYSVHFERYASTEHCFLLGQRHPKKIFEGCETLTKAVPKPELIPLARVVCSPESNKYPCCPRHKSVACAYYKRQSCGWSALCGKKCLPGEVFLRCFHQAHPDVLGIGDETTLA